MKLGVQLSYFKRRKMPTVTSVSIAAAPDKGKEACPIPSNIFMFSPPLRKDVEVRKASVFDAFSIAYTRHKVQPMTIRVPDGDPRTSHTKTLK